MRRLPHLTLIATLSATWSAACAGDAATPGRADVTDSAGVRVVVNAAVPPDSPHLWRLSTEPLVEIGVADGPAEYQFHQVGTGTLLSDGTVVVANGGSQELRYYDASGRHLVSAGGQGEGPGEFSTLALGGVLRGDSVLVWDGRLRRISVWGPDGVLGRTFQAPMEVGVVPIFWGATAEGRALLQAPDPAAGLIAANESRILRREEPAWLLGADGAGPTRLGDFPAAEVSMFFDGGPFQMGVIFGRELQLRAGGNRVAIGNNDDYSVRVHDADGQLLHVVRLAQPPRPVPEGEFERRRPRPSNSPIAARVEGAVAQMPRHATYPAFSNLLIGASDDLWVQDYRWYQDDGPSTWHVFDADGVLVGRLEMPERTELLHGTRDRVLVRVQDELGVQRIRVHGVGR